MWRNTCSLLITSESIFSPKHILNLTPAFSWRRTADSCCVLLCHSPRLFQSKSEVLFRKYNIAVGESVFVYMSTYVMKCQNSPWRDRNVLVTHRDELREGDHLLALGDGVEKQVLHTGHQPASAKIKQKTHTHSIDVIFKPCTGSNHVKTMSSV